MREPNSSKRCQKGRETLPIIVGGFEVEKNA